MTTHARRGHSPASDGDARLDADDMPPAQPGISRRRFIGNVGLFLIVVVLVCVWFKLHVEHHVEESWLIGGALSVWALFEIVHSALDWALEDEMKSLPQRILGSRRSTAYLWLAVILALALLACTSSVWVQYEASAEGKPAYKVRLSRRESQRLPFIDALDVASSSPADGRTFFFRWRPVELVGETEIPSGFVTKPKTLRWGRRLNFVVPKDLEPKQYHLVRLLPVGTLLNALEHAGVDVEKPCDLEIKWGAHRLVFRDVRRGAIYLGSTEREIHDVWLGEAVDDRKAGWNKLLQEAAPSMRDKLLQEWETTHAFLNTEPEFDDGDHVAYRIYRRDNNQPLVEGTATIEKDHAITNILLRAPNN